MGILLGYSGLILGYVCAGPGASQVALVIKNLPANTGDARDAGLIPGFRKIPWRREWLQYSCLENPMDRGAWQATVHRVEKSWT